ncbi:hypothetical protein [Nocardia salmonicida]|uniref:hypothetical protein n=1 Tax=Nocardia salmonicida TaxID=53431 RepID=UPI00379BF97C
MAIVAMLVIGAALFAGGSLGSSSAYSVDDIDNACDLVDPVPLNRWEDQHDKTEHEETSKFGSADGSLRCLIRNQDFNDVAELVLTASVNAEWAEDNFRTGKNLDQIGAEVVEIPDLGQQAYFRSDSEGCHHSADGSCLEHTIVVRDDDLLLRVRLLVEVGSGRAINDSEVAEVARVYVERAIASLRK